MDWVDLPLGNPLQLATAELLIREGSEAPLREEVAAEMVGPTPAGRAPAEWPHEILLRGSARFLILKGAACCCVSRSLERQGLPPFPGPIQAQRMGI